MRAFKLQLKTNLALLSLPPALSEIGESRGRRADITDPH